MRLTSLFRRERPEEAAAEALYLRLVEQARRPGFYSAGGVPDTLDGRFELIVLHAFLVLNRLKETSDRATVIGQSLYDYMFADMDRNLREMGVGDLSVGKHVKRMAEGFHGRVDAYDSALAEPPGALEEALLRNLYGTVVPVPAIVGSVADYVRREAASLSGQPQSELEAGRVVFGPAPGE